MVDPRLISALEGRYSIERELGGGGMSRVFIATETGLGRSVVIKVIAPELASGVSAERFAREVKLAARLQQANIVPLLSAGDANGLPYYTMPFVRGESLRARIARGDGVTTAEAIGILRDLARALSYAHGEGVVHRDIKPENVLLSGGTAVVTDFGIAKALSVSLTSEGTSAMTTGITQVGSAIGTPAYMAPEQSAGDPSTDHRADIYSWGVIAWELLAGRHPFATRSSSPQAMLAAHMAERPEALAKVNPALPPVLTGIVARCLEKDPAQRPASAAELVTALDSVTTPTTTGSSPIGSIAPRSRRVVLAAAAAVLFIAASIGLYGWRDTSASAVDSARTIVVIPFENLGATDDAYFAEGVTEEISGQLARIPGIQVVARASVRRFRGSTTPPHEIARQLGAAYALSGTIRWARAAGSDGNGTSVRIVPSLVRAASGAQVWGEPLQENPTDVFKAQAAIAERVANALSVTLGASERAALRRPESNDADARNAVMLGFSLVDKRGIANLRQAIALFDRAIARDSGYARAWAGRAEAYRLLPPYMDTTITFEQANAIAEPSARRALALDSLLSEAHSALATVLHERPSIALPAVDRAIELDPGSARAYSRRGTLLLSLGRVADAEAPLRRANALDPLVGAYATRLGWWYLAAGRADSAAMLMQRGTELDPSNTAIHYLGAIIYAHAGQADAAVEACTAHSPNTVACRDLYSGLVDPRQRARARVVLDERRLAIAPSYRAVAYARIGMADSAFAALREVVVKHDTNMFSVINSAWFKPLHADPRWDQIVGEIRRR